jgi:hypothetical protein
MKTNFLIFNGLGQIYINYTLIYKKRKTNDLLDDDVEKDGTTN